MNEIEKFQLEKKERIDFNGQDVEFRADSLRWVKNSMERGYVYNFEWMGRPIIQYPQDILALQEIIWKVKPDLIIETGIAHGGSIVFSASMLELIGGDGEVVGVDIDIRSHNRTEIEEHSMYRRIKIIEGSSISADVYSEIAQIACSKQNVLVILDSNHTHEHVLEELNLYGGLVTQGSYLIVLDTFVDDMPPGFFKDRPWDVGDNPKTAVNEYLESHPEFQVDKAIEDKLMITVAPNGYLKKV